MLKYLRYLFMVFITILMIFYTTPSIYAGNISSISTDVAHNELGFDLYSPHILLMEANSGKVLYEYNAREVIYPASTTKIMTAILALENCKLSDVAVVSYNAIHSIPATYATANIQEGEELTIEQLLHILLIPSANDAAIVLAEHIAGSVENFASMMNQKAIEIGCQNTHFVNPNGVHNENHVSTTYDMALVGRYAMRNTTFRNIVQKLQYSLPATNKYEKEDRIFHSTNPMLRQGEYYYPYGTGIKTGYTNPAGSCIVASAKKENREFILSIMGANRNENSQQSRDLDCKNLFEYAFRTYHTTELIPENTIVTSIEIPNATRNTKNLSVYTRDSIYALAQEEDLENASSEIIIRDDLEAPFLEGEVVGSLVYSVGDAIYETDLIASHNVYRIDYIKILLYILLAVFLLMLITTFAEMYRKKKRK